MAALGESWCARAMALADMVDSRPMAPNVEAAELEKDMLARHEQNQKQQFAFQNINRTLQDILSINSKLAEKKDQLHQMVQGSPSQPSGLGSSMGSQGNAAAQLPYTPPAAQEGGAIQRGGAGHNWPTRRHQRQGPSPTILDGVDITNVGWLYALEAASAPPPPPTQQTLPKRSTPPSKPQEGKLGMNRPLRDMPPDTTTLCIRNIPSRYSMEQLLQEFVVDGSFNLIHRPFNSNGNKKVGYVFVNFVNTEAAIRFQHRWHGKFLQNHGPTRALDVTSATIQGYEATLLPFAKRMQEFTDASQLPVTFKGSKRLDTMQEVMRLARFSEGKHQ